MAAPLDPARGVFDRAVLTLPSGEQRTLDRQQFDALPLGERVRAILNKQLRFYRGAEEVPMKDALKSR